MSHIFSYNKLSNGEDFIISDFYKDRQINAIPDPEGGNTKKIPTSIPSPFAVIDLAATAFQKLAATESLTGNLIYEKIVSQCLDIGMMFFKSQNLQNKLSIIEWDRQEEIRHLQESNIDGHRVLGQTLHMFLKDDADAYNFNQYYKIHIIKYNHNYLGGTSSKTLFYTALNPFENDKDNHIQLGNDDILFDTNYCPLYNRSGDFQIYLYTLIKNIEGFSTKCKELYDYLEKSKLILRHKNRSLFDQIENLNKDDYKKYLPLSTGKDGSYVTVLNTPLACNMPKSDGESDFKIMSSKYTGKLPMVLFPGFGGQNLFGHTMNYFDCKYSRDIDQTVPFSHEQSDINQRDLPGMTGIKYPYLLVDDLLEDTLFKTQSEINGDEFFNCNYFENDKGGFLCPIKKEFFKYFNAEDLLNFKFDDGKSIFELERRTGDAVKVTLRIPVNSGYITLTKTYLDEGQINKEKNIGLIKDLNIDVNIYPFIKFDPSKELGSQTDETNEYRTNIIMVGAGVFPKINFYNNFGSVLEKNVSKLKGDINAYSYNVNITKSYYDYIEIISHDKKCIIIPKWVERRAPSNVFHFAIDFGTTNTHIELRKNGQEAEPFTMKNNVFGRLSKNDLLLAEIANREFIPEFIDNTSNYKFHQRSVIAVTQSLDYSVPTHALGDFRIPFYYESGNHTRTTTSNYHTNLKWANSSKREDDEVRIEKFLEQLIIMMKAKVLSEEGKIKDTQFVWFFPSSMMRPRIHNLSKLWMKLLQKHFYIDLSKISKISESIAPFAYYMAREKVDSLVFPAATIDIGGGTSDIVIFKNDKPVYLSSFRYAANSIFGDGYNSNPENNGFVKKYLGKIKQILEANGLNNSLDALNSIQNSTSNSADIIAFFMSLEINSAIAGKTNISFQKLLASDEELKVVILLFYESLIFHLAKYLKHKDLEIPGVIVFSGNGGNLIKLLDDSTDFEILSEYTRLIFGKIFNTTINRKIDIMLNNNPKAVTCKGGLYINNDLNVDHSNITKVLVGSQNEPQILPTYMDLRNENNVIKSEVVKEVNACLQLFLDLNNDFSYRNNFSIGTGTLDLTRKVLMQEGIVERFLIKGINKKIEEIEQNTNDKIEETLFFYPFTGLLNELAYRIYSGN